MSLSTAVTGTLGVRHPIVLAPMDLVSDARLSLAVAAAGGFPFLGAGYGDEAWMRRELPLLARGAMPFGVGFITWSLARHPSLLDLALDHAPAAIHLSFGNVAEFAPRIRAARAKLCCQVQTEAMAMAALDAGADILVAQGGEAGGHGVGRGTLALVPALVDLAGAEIPVIAAGGIADGRGLAACLMLGAAGVSLGTRFYATHEAAGSEAAKRRILAASGDETQRGIVFDISRGNVWPAPFTGRCLANEHVRRWSGREVELLRAGESERERYAKARAEDDFDIAAVIAGEAAGLIHAVEGAGEVVERIAREAAALLAAFPKSNAAGA